MYFTQIFIYFYKPLRLLYSLIIYEIVIFSFFTLYSLLLLSFFLYLKSVPIYVIVHVHVHVLTTIYMYIHVHVHAGIHVIMRDARRKEERSKQGETNNKAKQHSTPKAVTFLNKMSCLGWDSNPQHSTL